jgi:hypothetical protein
MMHGTMTVKEMSALLTLALKNGELRGCVLEK